MRILRSLGTIGAGGALTLAALAFPVALAHAAPVQPRANGVFVYYDADGEQQTLTDPANLTCYKIDAPLDYPVLNYTDGTAVLFNNPDCSTLREYFETLWPGETGTTHYDVHSVGFIYP